MSIQKIVEQALKDGFLTPMMETEVGRICELASELSYEEYMALDSLMGGLLTGAVVAMPRKQFINVMEELVLSEAITRIAEMESKNNSLPDVGDIAAYALNRLPSLYATTEEGANYQRATAREKFQTSIRQQVKDGIQRYLERPEALGALIVEQKGILVQISDILQASAPTGEKNAIKEEETDNQDK